MKYFLYLILTLIFLQSCSSKKATIPATQEVTTFEEIQEVVKDLEVEIQQPYVRPKRYDFSYYNDANKLLEEMKDSKSDIFLDTILNRFQKMETLSAKQKIALLLAGTKMKGYGDKRLSQLNQEINDLHAQKKYKAAIQKSEECIEIFPLSIEGFLGKFNAHGALEEKEKSDEYFGKMHIIFVAMQKSGRMDNVDKPYIAFSEAALEGYTTLYAMGAGYRLLEQTKDKAGNDLYKYKCMGAIEYFVVPKK